MQSRMTISRLSGDSWAANTVFIAAIEFSGGDFAPSDNTAETEAADLADPKIGASRLCRTAGYVHIPQPVVP